MSIPSIEGFKANLVGGGARANQFKVVMNFPTASKGNVKTGEQFTYLCQSTELPASTIGIVEVPYRGRIMKLAGDRTFADWTNTILNDSDFKIRTALESWIDMMDQPLTEGGASVSPLLYKTTAEVKQLDRNGHEIKTYKFHGLLPSEIGNIAMSYDTNDAVETFDVTWSYDYFTVS